MSGYTTNPLLNTLRRARRLLLLQPDDANEVFQAPASRPRSARASAWCPAAASTSPTAVPQVVQVALP